VLVSVLGVVLLGVVSGGLRCPGLWVCGRGAWGGCWVVRRGLFSFRVRFALIFSLVGFATQFFKFSVVFFFGGLVGCGLGFCFGLVHVWVACWGRDWVLVPAASDVVFVVVVAWAVKTGESRVAAAVVGFKKNRRDPTPGLGHDCPNAPPGVGVGCGRKPSHQWSNVPVG